MTGLPFSSVLDLWFWFVEVHGLIQTGARPQQRGGRACTHADVLLWLERLHRRGRLTAHDVQVLFRYGREGRVPDPDHPAERAHAEIWRRGLAEIEREALRRGVVVRR